MISQDVLTTKASLSLSSPDCSRPRTIFEACCGVVKDHVDTALFLLPHIILNILLYGKQRDRDEISTEVCICLWGWAYMISECPSVGLQGVRTGAKSCIRAPPLHHSGWSIQVALFPKRGLSVEGVAANPLFLVRRCSWFSTTRLNRGSSDRISPCKALGFH